jgi:serine/threonine protein phosphatase 1
MREFVIGDILGCGRSLVGVLELIDPQPEDTVIFLGDYVDRGPDSCGVLEIVMDLGEICKVIPLVGNHEKMLLAAQESDIAFKEWLGYGGRATLESYARAGAPLDLWLIPDRHWSFLIDETVDCYETVENIFAHGTIDPQLSLADQPEELLFWAPFSVPTAHVSGKALICGHAAQKTGLPAIFDHGLCIDTFAYGGGWLTAYSLTDETFYQFNERGMQRCFDLKTLKKNLGVPGVKEK